MSRRLYTPDAPRFSRHWWLARARSFLWVALVTVLIWVYADMQFTDTVELHASLWLTTGRHADVVVLSESLVEVKFTVRGNRGSVESYRRRLDEDRRTVLCDLTALYGNEPRRQPARTEELLERFAGIADAGLSLVSVSPDLADVHIDRIHGEDVEVRFAYTGAVLSEPAEVSPAKIPVRVPESRWKRVVEALAGKKPVLATKLTDLTNQPAGAPRKLAGVEIIPSIPPDEGVALHPAELGQTTVDVTVHIEQTTRRKPLTVSVQPLYPRAWTTDGTWAEYEIELPPTEDWQKQITVTGPQKDLDRLRPEHVTAYVRLSEDAKKPGYISHNVEVDFPDEMQVELVGARPTLSLRLKKRAAAPP